MKTHVYRASDSAAFRKTRQAWGGFSNMANGYPIVVNGLRYLTSEALYQALKFPNCPQAQRDIRLETNPMQAKRTSRRYDRNCRPDWLRTRVKVMNWCLEAKLAANFTAFSELLMESHPLDIVENSSKDDFWGAFPQGDNFVGQNVLGRLLKRLRQQLMDADDLDRFLVLEPLDIPDFTLESQPVATVDYR